MIPSCAMKGKLSGVSDKSITDKETGEITRFKVFEFFFDCYIPEIGHSVTFDKVKRSNHQQYVPADDSDMVALYSSIPPAKPCVFSFGIAPKLSAGRAKLRLILEKFQPLA